MIPFSWTKGNSSMPPPPCFIFAALFLVGDKLSRFALKVLHWYSPSITHFGTWFGVDFDFVAIVVVVRM